MLCRIDTSASEQSAALAEPGPAWQSHLAPLLPPQLVCAAFLAPEARPAIGQVAGKRRPAGPDHAAADRQHAGQRHRPGAGGRPNADVQRRGRDGGALHVPRRGGARGRQLADIGTLQAGDAALALAFAPGLALPDEGTSLALMDFAAFDGAFDPARVRICGIDAQRVDLSRLGVDGTVAITPVPEPGAVAMMLAGLVAVGWRGRRKG